jgi:hypothetical protein
MMVMNGDTPTQEGSVPDEAVQVLASGKEALKEREKKQITFISECTLDQDVVVVDKKGLKASEGSSSKNTALHIIKGELRANSWWGEID